MYTKKILNRYQKSKMYTEWRHKKWSHLVYIFMKSLQKILLYLDSITNFLRDNFVFEVSNFCNLMCFFLYQLFELNYHLQRYLNLKVYVFI